MAEDIPKILEDAIRRLQEQDKPLVFEMYCMFCKTRIFVEYPIPYKCPKCGGPWMNYI